MTPDDVTALMGAWATGAASDAQMAAWCATAGVRGVPYEASLAVLRALLGSGDRLELTVLGNTADIRSTGGVGDSALIIAASVAAAALGVRIASTGARSIAHVGGVLDALDAIPGMRTRVSVEEYVVQAREVGMVIADPGERLVPDERRLADLRDATATAEGDAFVTVAAVARGISGGSGLIVLEIPAGRGGLLPDIDHARGACDLAVRLGTEWGRTLVATPCLRDAPLAGVAGHALEVRAALDLVAGEGDPDLRTRVVEVARMVAETVGLDGADAAVVLTDGRAAAVAERWITAQGGDPRVVGNRGHIPVAGIRREVGAARPGRVESVAAGQVGAAARWLGAGRLDPGQVIDSAVGVEVVAGSGVRISEGDVLAIVHASDDWLAGRAVDMLQSAFSIGPD